jgi:4-carboxymuconolactone decarboxylase
MAHVCCRGEQADFGQGAAEHGTKRMRRRTIFSLTRLPSKVILTTRLQQCRGRKSVPQSDYTNDVLYGDIWECKGLSKRDRSLIIVAALVATYRPEQLVSHLTRAINHGIIHEEITEVITYNYMAFYLGWSAAMSAVAYAVLVEGNRETDDGE